MSKLNVVFLSLATGALLPSLICAEEVHDGVSVTDSAIEVRVTAAGALIDAPSSSYHTSASQLEYHPLIDVQTRNFADAQSDIAIRGATFENSGFQLGATQLRDPQTGHYVAELPIAPQMLTPLQLITGFNNDLFGSNATSGTLSFGWARIDTMTAFQGAVGTHQTYVGELYSGWSKLVESDIGSLGIDISAAGSESEGTRAGGDNHLGRVNIRFQLVDDSRQTDLFLGRQDKFFAWPYLYALKPLHDLVGSSGIETEDLETQLLILNHRSIYGDGSFYELGGSLRHNDDDYEFDRFNPGLFNPFKHQTRRSTVSASGVYYHQSGDLTYRAEFAADDINSTALTFGNFDSRRSLKLALVPGVTFNLSEYYSLRVQAGAGLDDTNREEQHVSPLIRIAAIRSGENDTHEIYASFSRSSQVPSYTALSSNPSAGLFRGNAGLADEVTRTSEVGWDIRSELWTIHSAIFLRSTKDLTDWIYDPTIRPFAARSAANVDLDTWGSEFVAIYDFAIARIGGSYTYLHKDIESAQAPQRGSFYALNFPTHRATAAVSLALADDIELSSAVEFRNQFENELRSSQDKTYLLQRAAISYQVSEQVKLSLAGDNLWKENFEDVPGVRGPGRTAMLRVSVSTVP